MQGYPVRKSCSAEALKYEVLKLIIKLQSVKMPVLIKGGSHAYGRVAGESSQFQNPLCLCHLHKHAH